jgi:DNA recombination protein RmuC
VVSTGRKFRDLNIETGARELSDVPAVEALASAGTVVTLSLSDQTSDGTAEAAE